MALSVVEPSGENQNEAIVSILVDGQIPPHSFIRKHPGQQIAMVNLTPPIEVAAGSVINFLTRKNCPAKSSIVSLLIELDQ